MAENRTKPTDVDVAGYIAAVEHPQRRADAQELCATMQRLTGEAPRMWGPTMIGFGEVHYRYQSGHEGDMFRVGFAPRKAQLAIYLTCDLDQYTGELERLGKWKRGAGCLYVNRLADIDRAVLEGMIVRAYAEAA